MKHLIFSVFLMLPAITSAGWVKHYGWDAENGEYTYSEWEDGAENSKIQTEAPVQREDICPGGWEKSKYWITTEITSGEPIGLIGVEICPDNGLIRVPPKENSAK